MQFNNFLETEYLSRNPKRMIPQREVIFKTATLVDNDFGSSTRKSGVKFFP